MAYKRRAAGAWVDVAAIKRRSAGAWVTCANVYRRSAGAWIKVWPISALVNIIGATVSAIGGSAAGATARYRLTSGGQEESKEGLAAYVTIGTWLLSGSAGDYDVRATLLSGLSPDSGTVGSWENLATTREWTQTGGVADPQQSDLLIEIRLTSTGIVQDSATVTLIGEQF